MASTSPTAEFDAIVLAGGAGRRLGGQDKPGLLVGPRSLLEHALTACAGASRTVVVGPQREVSRPVVWTQEQPALGGPVAALVAGLAHVEADVVVLLAADAPFVDATVVTRLVVSAPAVAVDGTGREQWLLSAWPAAALRGALSGVPVSGAALREVLGALLFGPVHLDPAVTADCDTPDDLASARSRWDADPLLG